MKIKPQNIRIDNYDYDLPDQRIAKYPLVERDKSQLLIYNNGTVDKDIFENIDCYIDSDTTCVFNNTKVIQARLMFYKETGARIEIFCLEPIDPSDYVLAFQQTKNLTWKCIIGNLKKWKDQDLNKTIHIGGKQIILTASKKGIDGNAQIVEFSWDNSDYTFSDILENIGVTPIPPYLNRKSETIDKDRYQTVYSKLKGSVAAPTAGLHFTDKVFDKLRSKDVQIEEITLHVGAGTFNPVKAETIDGHEMHAEHFVITKASLEKLISSKKIVAVGTTSVRTIESLHWLGVKLLTTGTFNSHIKQWEAYELPDYSKEQSLEALLNYMQAGKINQLHASTQIMIFPGYTFKLVDALVTNFHQPKSTLLLLIAALIGDNWQKVYRFAMENDFRFLSYGDSSVLIP